MKSSLLILLSSLIVTFSFLESHENNEIVNKPVRIKKSNETDYQTLSELENNYVKDSAGNWVTFGGAWDDRFSGYNCYGYSIDRCEQNLVTGNYSSKYQIGYFSGLNYSSNLNVDSTAQIVKSDLESIGFTNVVLSSSKFNLSSSEEMICLRKDNNVPYDYHFMRYKDGSWYHKPGGSAILKYKYDVSNSVPWTCELSLQNSIIKYTNTIYDSNIIYIKFDSKAFEVNASSSKTLHINQNKDNMIHLKYINNVNYIMNVSNNSQNSLSVDAYDDNFDLITTYSGSSLSIDLSSKNIKHMRFYNQSGSQDNISLSVHSHSYEYKWINKTKHVVSCSCGYQQEQPHVVINTGSISKRCALCGGIADIGFIGLSTNYSTPRSFILPNGVIVLTMEDFELYLKGELEL